MPNTELIKIQLIRKKLTVQELASRLGMRPCDCSKLIHGHRPFYAYQERAAKLLGIEVEKAFPVRRRAAS